MARLEIGRINNLGSSRETDEEVAEKKPIGFIGQERKSEEKHKLDRIGFAPPSSETREPTEEPEEK